MSGKKFRMSLMDLCRLSAHEVFTHCSRWQYRTWRDFITRLEKCGRIVVKNTFWKELETEAQSLRTSGHEIMVCGFSHCAKKISRSQEHGGNYLITTVYICLKWDPPVEHLLLLYYFSALHIMGLSSRVGASAYITSTSAPTLPNDANKQERASG